jgi:cytochrome bd-type quinol oxidase subunit 1
MEFDPLLLSRVQFAFVISFHIIFPSFTIGLAAWLAVIEGVRLSTGNPVYRRVFDFWLKVFALSFGMGVVSGIVMAFQFGTNWSMLAERVFSLASPCAIISRSSDGPKWPGVEHLIFPALAERPQCGPPVLSCLIPV